MEMVRVYVTILEKRTNKKTSLNIVDEVIKDAGKKLMDKISGEEINLGELFNNQELKNYCIVFKAVDEWSAILIYKLGPRNIKEKLITEIIYYGDSVEYEKMKEGNSYIESFDLDFFPAIVLTVFEENDEVRKVINDLYLLLIYFTEFTEKGKPFTPEKKIYLYSLDVLFLQRNREMVEEYGIQVPEETGEEMGIYYIPWHILPLVKTNNLICCSNIAPIDCLNDFFMRFHYLKEKNIVKIEILRKISEFSYTDVAFLTLYFTEESYFKSLGDDEEPYPNLNQFPCIVFEGKHSTNANKNIVVKELQFIVATAGSLVGLFVELEKKDMLGLLYTPTEIDRDIEFSREMESINNDYLA